MSKKSNPNVPANSINYYENEPFVFRRWMMGNLEGRLLTLVEAFGFETKREDAVKSLVRNELWQWFRDNLVAFPEDKHKLFEEFINENVYKKWVDPQGNPIK